jgi:outer membrane receptor for monomeric catechols
VQLAKGVSFYLGLRQIGSLPLANVPAYFEADARLAWQITPTLELSLAGYNLVHAHHLEATNGFGQENSIPRSVLVGLRRSF